MRQEPAHVAFPVQSPFVHFRNVSKMPIQLVTIKTKITEDSRISSHILCKVGERVNKFLETHDPIQPLPLIIIRDPAVEQTWAEAAGP